MTVGEWLDSVASHPRNRPDAYQMNDREQRQDPGQSNSLETLDRKLAELNRRLKRLSDTSRSPQRDRRPDRDNGQMSRRPGRDRGVDDEMRREAAPDPVAARLDQIDRRLAEFGKTRDAGDQYGREAQRVDTQTVSDVDRLRQGLREIERLQATLLDGLNARGAKVGQALDRHIQEDRERSNRSPVAETISRLETEVRNLRQSVENRLEPAKPAFDDSDLQDMRRMLERMAEVNTGRQESTQIERLFDEMNRLRDLVVETGTKALGATSVKSTQELRLADMVERLASVATHAQEKTTDDMRSLDRRLADVAERMADLEGRGATSKDIGELQRAIDTIAAKLDRPVPPAPKPVIPAGLLDLDIRIEKLGAKLDRLEPNPAASRQMAALEAEIGALRLDLAQSVSSRGASQVEDQINALGARIDRLAASAASNGTAKLESQINTLGERIDRLANFSSSVGGSIKLESQISTLGDRIEKLASSSGNSDRLESQINTLSDRIERLATSAQAGGSQGANIAEFESRISDLVDIIDRLAGSGNALDKHLDSLQGEISALRRDLSGLGGSTRNEALEEQMRLLAERLESAGHQGGDPRMLARIDEKIERLANLLNVSERGSVDTAGIEEKLDQLGRLLAERRDDTLEAASTAAREAVREFASFAADARQSDAGIRAFEEGLRQVQESARSTESRTSDALQSVHDALTAIVGRLGAMERTPTERVAERPPIHRDPSERLSGEQLAPNRPAMPQMSDDMLPTMPSPPSQARAVEPPPSAEDHRPLEPGSGKPRGAQPVGPTTGRAPQPGTAPQMPQSAYTAPRGPAAAAPESEAGPKRNDFIAAARRAAQAASQPGPGAPPPIPGERMAPAIFLNDADEEPQGKKSLFASLFKRRQKTLILAGVGVAAAATTVAFITSSILHVASVDTMPTASIATPAKQVAAANTPAANAAAIALAPPSSVTSTFAPSTTDDTTRQAALADAVKQAALAQGIKSQQPAAQPTAVQPSAPQTMIAGLADSTASDATTTQSIGRTAPQTPVSAQVPPPPEKIGSPALRAAASKGDPKAQFEIAMRYSEGRNVASDMHEACVWFERAASQGLLPAAYRLGSAYEKGLGVDRSPTEAKRWYRIAAEGGNIRAMHNLGVMYANDRDMPSALPWFQKAADAGLKDSQFNLGIIYALGSGVKQDLGMSYKWFALGANQGDQEAVRKRDDIATRMDHTTLAAAKLAVSTWKPTPISRDANEETAVWTEPGTASAQPSTAPVVPPPPSGWTKLMQAQAALQGKGLYVGKVDGEMTPETKAAIKAFQKRAGLRQTGEVDQAVLGALHAKQM
jgi:localization factor PodJL